MQPYSTSDIWAVFPGLLVLPTDREGISPEAPVKAYVAEKFTYSEASIPHPALL